MTTRPRSLLEESIKNEINLKKETKDGLGRRNNKKLSLASSAILL